ncbi:MAG: PQQ-binding-like beta-propeller repeat protein [Flavisolibacter sp.]|nr:PQQ-binding-like beta-propeller repeat protein [Flavisolibacter sp.]
MKRLLLFLCFLPIFSFSQAQFNPFRFAFISDTHIGSPNGTAEEDLTRTVNDINNLEGVAFVVITGDITELGTPAELRLAKKILDALKIPYYIIPGNHDTGWSESGGLDFTTIFGTDKFHFNYNGIHFIGCPSGPYVRMSDGHVPRDAMNWMQQELSQLKNNEPVIFLNHYPLDPGLDNWYEVIDMLKQKNTLLALCGHGHNNRDVQAEEIPAVMGRSNLRAKAKAGGYNLVDVHENMFVFTERNPLAGSEKEWKRVPLKDQQYDLSAKFPRPDFSMNENNNEVKPAWSFQSSANVISTPAATGKLVVFGNQEGVVQALHQKTGRVAWSFSTAGPIFSSPAVSGNHIVLGSADGYIYSLSTSGKLNWKVQTKAPVLGSPLIQENVVFIGGSDSGFRAIDLSSGKLLWTYKGIGGPVVSQPVVYNELLIFGAWDLNLYALNKNTGALLWKWNNGSTVRNYSPASCIPVINDGVVYIAAPDRYLTAIDIQTGKTLWRTNESTVRESIGISADGKYVYGKTMNDTVVAYVSNREQVKVAWKLHAGYGYEHAPSMLIENNGTVFFGTRNGIVYAIDPNNKKVKWRYKLDNSMVNTVNVLNKKQVLVSTMNGRVMLLKTK